MSEHDDLTILPVNPPKDDAPLEIRLDPRLPNVNRGKGSCILLCAGPCSGKTVWITNALLNPNFYGGKLDETYIFSSTIHGGDGSSAPLLKAFGKTTFSEYSDAKLQAIIDYQMSFEKKERPVISIVFDDIGAWGLKQNALCWGLSSFYRHCGVGLLIYSAQKYKQVSPLVRQCINWAFFWRQTNEKQAIAAAEELGLRFKGPDGFLKLLETATKENRHHFLTLDLMGNPAIARRNFEDPPIFVGERDGVPQTRAARGYEPV